MTAQPPASPQPPDDLRRVKVLEQMGSLQAATRPRAWPRSIGALSCERWGAGLARLQLALIVAGWRVRGWEVMGQEIQLPLLVHPPTPSSAQRSTHN